MQMLQLYWLSDRTVSTISVQWPEMATFCHFSTVFEAHFDAKWIIKFLKEGYNLRFPDLKN